MILKIILFIALIIVAAYIALVLYTALFSRGEPKNEKYCLIISRERRPRRHASNVSRQHADQRPSSFVEQGGRNE